MAAERSAQQANALLTKYLTLYDTKYGRKPTINRYKEKWAMKDVIESVGYPRAQELLEYYFTTGRTGHPLQWFFYNFDRLDETLKELGNDNEKRRQLREETKRRAAEWKVKNESRSEGN